MKNLSIKKYLILVAVVIMCCIVVTGCGKEKSIKDDYPDTVMILTTNDPMQIIEKYDLVHHYGYYSSYSMVDGQECYVEVEEKTTGKVQLNTGENLTVERVENYKKLLIELFGSKYTTEYPRDYEYRLKWDNGVALSKGKNDSAGLCKITIIKE